MKNYNIAVVCDNVQQFDEYVSKHCFHYNPHKDYTHEDCEDSFHNKYTCVTLYTSLCGRSFDKIVDIRQLSNRMIERLSDYDNINIEYGGISLTRQHKED